MTDYYIQKDDAMRILLKESDVAFSIMMEAGGNMNTDYADFTANHFIKSFRHVMQKPDLSRMQLASMLRAAHRRRRQMRKTKPEDSWSLVMSQLMTKGANSNSAQI